jgi:hypothetical protein
MYAIKAEFDGTKVTLKEPVPVTGPYEAIVTFTSPKAQSRLEALKAEGRRKAEERRAEWERTGVDPLQKYCGILKDIFPEDGLEYQRKMRDEWPD